MDIDLAGVVPVLEAASSTGTPVAVTRIVVEEDNQVEGDIHKLRQAERGDILGLVAHCNQDSDLPVEN